MSIFLIKFTFKISGQELMYGISATKGVPYARVQCVQQLAGKQPTSIKSADLLRKLDHRDQFHVLKIEDFFKREF